MVTRPAARDNRDRTLNFQQPRFDDQNEITNVELTGVERAGPMFEIEEITDDPPRTFEIRLGESATPAVRVEEERDGGWIIRDIGLGLPETSLPAMPPTEAVDIATEAIETWLKQSRPDLWRKFASEE